MAQAMASMLSYHLNPSPIPCSIIVLSLYFCYHSSICGNKYIDHFLAFVSFIIFWHLSFSTFNPLQLFFHLTLQYPNNLLIQTNVFVVNCLIHMHMTKQMLFIFSYSFHFFQIISQHIWFI